MKNLTYINVIILLVMSMWANTALAIPSITATASAGTTIKFTATLSEKLLSGYKVKIDYGNGKGLVVMTCSSTTCSLSSNSLPVGVNSASYKIGIYNAKGILQGSITDGTYTIISPLTTDTSTTTIPSTSSSVYVKISNEGATLADSAKLGTSANDWACTKDKKTGLIWEVKTNNDDLRDTIKTYTIAGALDFTSAVNSKSLCGSKNWRLPTFIELQLLLSASKNEPYIDTVYFPNTQSLVYWTSSPYTSFNNYNYVVNFGSNETNFRYDKNNYYNVRLVHQ
ncbi:MAG: hypothetical protein RLZZ66_538 [Pseudomonadota bacterium]|jgi:hypothetical protein